MTGAAGWRGKEFSVTGVFGLLANESMTSARRRQDLFGAVGFFV
jgi:hypothetical protein